MPASPHPSALARHQKAVAIADGIWARILGDPPADLAERTAALDQEGRDAVAAAVDQGPPTEAEWAAVVFELDNRVALYVAGREAAHA